MGDPSQNKKDDSNMKDRDESRNKDTNLNSNSKYIPENDKSEFKHIYNIPERIVPDLAKIKEEVHLEQSEQEDKDNGKCDGNEK